MVDQVNYSANIGYAKAYRLPELWNSLHLSINSWECDDPLRLNSENDVATSDKVLRLMKCLVDTPLENWLLTCRGAGMTVFGAVALSWCKGAEIEDVWEGWEASGFPLKPLPEFERPARFLNPALMPKTRSLKGIVEEVGNSSLAICATIASRPEPLEFDLPTAQMQAARQQLAAFLKSRMLEKQNRTGEEEALLTAWSETIQGTDYDIWEGS